MAGRLTVKLSEQARKLDHEAIPEGPRVSTTTTKGRHYVRYFLRAWVNNRLANVLVEANSSHSSG
jgi:hypothetical protein